MKACVVDAVVPVREEATGDARVVGELHAGEQVELGGEIRASGGNFVAVVSPEATGFVDGAARIIPMGSVRLAQESAGAFREPMGGTETVRTIRSGEPFTVEGAVNDGSLQWIKVRTQSGETGYLEGDIKWSGIPDVPARGPLEVTIRPGDCRARLYAEATKQKTIEAIRADVLLGDVRLDSGVATRTANAKGAPAEWSGTLEQFARRHGRLGELYWPLRDYSRKGLIFGVVAGIGIAIFLDGLMMYQVNPAYGAMVMALPVCILLQALGNRAPAGLSNMARIGAVALPALIGFSGLLSFVLGGAVMGAVQFSLPGMAIGAVVGAVRRPNLVKAPEAQRESVILRTGLPALGAVALWTLYGVLVTRYLPGMLPDFVRRYR